MWNIISYLFILSCLTFSQRYIYKYGNELIVCFQPDVQNPLSEYKKNYIIKNVWKSALLCIILIGGLLPLIDGFYNNVWSNLSIKFWGTIYAAVDMGGLVYVRGLPRETVIHHIIVNLFGILNYLVDYNEPGYYRSMLIYTCFSIFPYIVNLYLALRYIIQDDKTKVLLATCAYYIYVYSLTVNITTQIVFFATSPFYYSLFIYIGLFSLILNDDIKLIKFLAKEANINYNVPKSYSDILQLVQNKLN